MLKRKTVKISLVIFSILAIALFTASCGGKSDTNGTDGSSSKEKVTLRLVVATPAGGEMTTICETLAQRFNERAGGEYEINVHPGESLVKIGEFLDAVRTGAVEMSDISYSIFAGKDPKLEALQLPFLYDTPEQLVAALPEILELYTPFMEETFNIHPLGLCYSGSNDYMGKKPVKTLADWKGVIVGSSDPSTTKMIEYLGGSGIAVAFPDMYSAMDKGVIDAELQSTNGALDMKHTDIIKHATLFFGCPATMAYSINLDVWKKMPKHIQDILTEEAQKIAKEKSELFLGRRAKDIETYRSMGIEVYELPADERAKWKAAVEPFLNEKLASVGDFGKKLKDIVDKHKK